MRLSKMQIDKLSSYIGIAMQGGNAIIGSDNLDGYTKKLYLALVDKAAGKTSKKVFAKLQERGIEGHEIDGLDEVIGKNIKIIAFKNKGLSEEIKKYL